MSIVLFFGICGMLLLLPFVPAWWEWRHPSDQGALPVPPDAGHDPGHLARLAREGRLPGHVHASDGDLCLSAGSSHRVLVAHGSIDVQPGARILEWAHANRVIHLHAGSVGLRRLTAGEAIELERDCCFERLHAPVVRFGPPDAAEEAGAAWPAEPAPEAPEHAWSSLGGAQLARADCWFFDGDCEVPDGASFRGSAVVAGVLRLGPGAIIRGDVKARRGLLLGPGCRIEGAVTCERDIHLLDGASASGPVIAERTVFLADRVRVGAPSAPTTVSAPNVVAQVGSRVHGTAWAHQAGVVWEPA